MTNQNITTITDADLRMHNAAIDVNAGELRALLLSKGIGQQMIYVEKENEANRLSKDMVSPDPDDYPLLSVDMDINNVTLQEAADSVRFRANAFRAVGAEIERLRLTAKKTLKDTRDATIVYSTIGSVSESSLRSALLSKGYDLDQLM